MQVSTKHDTGEGDKSIHLAAETMLIHISRLVELGGRCVVQNHLHRFSDSGEQLYDVLGPLFMIT
jgi:hypothetical protein